MDTNYECVHNSVFFLLMLLFFFGSPPISLNFERTPLPIITTLHYHRAVVEHKAAGRERIPIFAGAQQHAHRSTGHIRSDAGISCGRPLANVNLMGFLPALDTPTRRTDLPSQRSSY